jgi:NADPH:quinone reductase-like Zn-dependent oxidoreductase
LPSKISFAEGSVLPLAIDTALVGLIGHDGQGLGLPLPSLNPKPIGKTIVVWGGSSSVGALAIQLAAAAGARVITTASSHNFDFVKKAGATAAVDYKKSSVVDDVVEAVKNAGGEFVGVYDAISVQDQSCKLPCASCLYRQCANVIHRQIHRPDRREARWRCSFHRLAWPGERAQ